MVRTAVGRQRSGARGLQVPHKLEQSIMGYYECALNPASLWHESTPSQCGTDRAETHSGSAAKQTNKQTKQTSTANATSRTGSMHGSGRVHRST